LQQKLCFGKEYQTGEYRRPEKLKENILSHGGWCYRWYNEKRRHGYLGRLAPELVWKKFNPISFENEKLQRYL
jgi:transposase InsO family protein